MDYLLICIAAFLTSGLTFFSGFGLGTLLMPVFALFFPVELAVALTAVVHLLNNLFKLALLGRHADRQVLLLFGVPAVIAAYVGARALVGLGEMPPLMTYELGGRAFAVAPINLVMGVLIGAFAMLELAPRLAALSFSRRYLPVGGILSGFFGGLSGHQGALRAAFLIRLGLSKESFLATGIVIACLVDVSRLAVYSTHFPWQVLDENRALLAAAVLSAFAGALVARRLLHKITLRGVQIVVGAMLLVIAAVLGAGLAG